MSIARPTAVLVSKSMKKLSRNKAIQQISDTLKECPMLMIEGAGGNVTTWASSARRSSSKPAVMLFNERSSTNEYKLANLDDNFSASSGP